MSHPRIGITMGDPAGVGPEVVVKALAHAEVYAQCRPLVIGDARRLGRAAEIAGAQISIRTVREPEDARFEPGAADCIDLALVPPDLPFGKLSVQAGEAAYRYV